MLAQWLLAQNLEIEIAGDCQCHGPDILIGGSGTGLCVDVQLYLAAISVVEQLYGLCYDAQTGSGAVENMFRRIVWAVVFHHNADCTGVSGHLYEKRLLACDGTETVLHGIFHENLHHHCRDGDFIGLDSGVDALDEVEVFAQGRAFIGDIGVDKVELLSESDGVAVAQLKVLSHKAHKIVDTLIVGGKLTIEHIEDEVRREAVAHIGKALRNEEAVQLHLLLDTATATHENVDDSR